MTLMRTVAAHRDPLRRLTATPLTTDLCVMGRRIRLQTNSAAVFGAMEVWMVGDDRSLGELARLCHAALESLRAGLTDSWNTAAVRQVSS